MRRYCFCLLCCLSFWINGLAQSKVKDLSLPDDIDISALEESQINQQIYDVEKKIGSLENKVDLYDNRVQYQKETQRERYNELEKRLESTKQDLHSRQDWMIFIISFLTIFMIFIIIAISLTGYYIGKRIYQKVEEQREKASTYLDEINEYIKNIRAETEKTKVIQQQLSELSSGYLTDEVSNADAQERAREIATNQAANSFEKSWAKALISYYSKDYFDALSKLNSLLEEYPSQINLQMLAHIYFSMASCYYHNNNYSIALMYCDSILSLDPVNETAYCNKGIVLSKFVDRQQEALECLEKAIEINPYDSQPWTTKGNILLSSGNYREAIQQFDKALKIAPSDYIAWSNKGVILSKYLEHHEEAIKCLDTSIELNENYLLAWVHKGHILTLAHRHSEAIACYDKILEKDPTNEIVKECKKDLLNTIHKEMYI